jgi:hypothetical protein
MDGAGDWPGELRAALVEQFLGPPRRARWLRFLASLAIMIAFALVIPRIDHWPQTQGWPAFALIGIPLSGIWAVHREHLLRRSRSRQFAVYVAAVITFAAGWIELIALSVTFGSEPGSSPIERLAAQIPPLDIPLWLVVGLLLVLAFWRYRSDKGEEAALRAQADVERSTLAAPLI